MKSLQMSHMLANGDTAVLVYFKSNPEKNRLIQYLAMFIRSQKITGICEVVPASQSVQLVFSEPLELATVIDEISALIKFACDQSFSQNHRPKSHRIKVCYDPKVALDLEQVLADCDLTLEQLIAIHTADKLTLTMLGFLPGFAYLDGLDNRLSVPRKHQPSQHTAAGSIAIAGRQTGIYALNSPGGWHVIGQTPQPLIDWQSANPLAYKPLDQIQFEAITYAEFEALSS